MTTNIDRAAEVLRDDKHYKMGPHGEQFLTSEAARSLADAGLLMPDLPEPRYMGSGIACFPRGVEVWDRRTVHVCLADDYGQGEARLTPQEARAYGEELIAAANYAEQEQGNG